MKIQDYPQRIVIELTAACNLSCSMCPRRYIEKKDGHMSGDLWRRLINEISGDSPHSIILPFWRGESLLHPEFSELLRFALDKSLRVHIASNGMLVKGRYAATLADCEFVTFSIHNETGYERAKSFLAFKHGKSPVVQVSFVKNEKTTGEICSLLINSADLGGFDSIRIYDEHSKDGIFGKSGHFVDHPRNFCPKLEDTLVIAYDGSVSRCNHIWETENRLNANGSSIKEIWDSHRLDEIRREYPDSKCSSCDQWIGHTCGESYKCINDKIQHNLYTADSILTN
ncbi:MAG: radical SAM protein [Candidatus Omnitrophica bacterium]|nr:radical SAM protein [Candidatus Omnitrophota bacterium]